MESNTNLIKESSHINCNKLKGSNVDQKSPKNKEKESKNTTLVKSQHKVEGKNKKSLHQKQAAQEHGIQQANSNASNNSSSNRRGHHTKNNTDQSTKPLQASSNSSAENDLRSAQSSCSTLEAFSKRAVEIKSDIKLALEKQVSHQFIDQPVEVVKLKNDILKLADLGDSLTNTDDIDNVSKPLQNNLHGGEKPNISDTNESSVNPQLSQSKEEAIELIEKPSYVCSSHGEDRVKSDQSNKADELNSTKSTQSVDSTGISVGDHHSKIGHIEVTSKSVKKNVKFDNNNTSADSQDKKPYNSFNKDVFEPLNAKLDCNSKVVALISSLQKNFDNSPHLIEQVCRKLVNLSEQNVQLHENCDIYKSENSKLILVKQKLESLCRELQKSNNAIRIESLDLIKVEQGKAKEQTTKIQSTLSGVIKLFDENQQRNMSLRQENQDLQIKLKSLLDHCDNWEKSVEAALRQRDIENRLLKTELAKANLIKNEEKEKFLGEKQELLQILSLMQEQQHRIEGQEAKLRSDLSSYASKYDECQAVISKGMNKFQIESKKMLKQIEKSKQDYRALLSKYEASNRKMAQLLEEKQSWDKAMNTANKKIVTLEKLCRALRERKLENKLQSAANVTTQKKSNSNKNNKSITNSDKILDELIEATTLTSLPQEEEDAKELITDNDQIQLPNDLDNGCPLNEQPAHDDKMGESVELTVDQNIN